MNTILATSSLEKTVNFDLTTGEKLDVLAPDEKPSYLIKISYGSKLFVHVTTIRFGQWTGFGSDLAQTNSDYCPYHVLA